MSGGAGEVPVSPALYPERRSAMEVKILKGNPDAPKAPETEEAAEDAQSAGKMKRTKTEKKK